METIAKVCKLYYNSYFSAIRIFHRHVLPKSLISTVKDQSAFDDSMKLGKPIIIYFHGNSGSRLVLPAVMSAKYCNTLLQLVCKH